MSTERRSTRRRLRAGVEVEVEVRKGVTWMTAGGWRGTIYGPLADTITEPIPEEEAIPDGLSLIAAERARQKTKWGPGHDDRHKHAELARAAAMLAVDGTDADVVDRDEFDGWGLVAKHAHNRVSQLAIAGALIAAELDRKLRYIRAKKIPEEEATGERCKATEVFHGVDRRCNELAGHTGPHRGSSSAGPVTWGEEATGEDENTLADDMQLAYEDIADLLARVEALEEDRKRDIDRLIRLEGVIRGKEMDRLTAATPAPAAADGPSANPTPKEVMPDDGGLVPRSSDVTPPPVAEKDAAGGGDGPSAEEDEVAEALAWMRAYFAGRRSGSDTLNFNRAIRLIRAGQEDTRPVPDYLVPVLGEIERAVKKFPTWPTDPLHALAVLGEEFGELTQAALQYTYEPHKSTREDVKTEATQVAAMALRFLASLDHYDFIPGQQHRQGSSWEASDEE